MTDYSQVVKILSLNDSKDEVIIVPKKVYKNIRDKNGEVLVKIGMRTINIPAIEKGDREDTIILSSSLMEKTGLLEDTNCHLQVEGNTLRLGPVIGVFSSNKYINKLKQQVIPKFRLFELVKANQTVNTILYFFTFNDVNFDEKTVRGIYYDFKDNLWKENLFPIPDVLYDRGGGFRKHEQEPSQRIRSFFNELGVKKLNAQYHFDKWDVYEKLSGREEIKEYLPLTIEYKTYKDLLWMFQHNRTIYLKYVAGSNGQRIMRVTKLNNNRGYHFSYYEKKLITRKVRTLKALIKAIHLLYKNQKVIIQEAIPLMRINNQLIDFRTTGLRNKDGDLQWGGFPVRIGKAHSPVTSTRTGAIVYRFEHFWQERERSEEQIEALRTEIIRFLTKVYEAIEAAYGSFGELGLDYAVDRNGKLWFIECNAKPGKDSLYMAYDEETVQKAFIVPLEYAKKISGF